MKYFSWDAKKNEQLKQRRGVSFEEVLLHIASGDVLDVVEHPNLQRYGGQRIFVVNIGGYAYLVPFVETGNQVFLKTIIPSRKATKRYLPKEKNDGETKR
ncbi:MAG: BrnT family toxin [Deltaproteobacteria bacterium]|nr:BrnT family toxin [Deltaproteobacteria bacterium]